ncbi:Uu.00g021470.m01.CDS01 [Anthostomella pinea]|uniref:Uu.00g021470.m01.CDS01 n=1 Tax=Anthostomella pinea TaxID=933095 RepID=A0AAI8YQU7_9PEZI|nr:Uu.00g021470.m01.CDS01 [Anthostomella pinea]
MSTEQQPPTKIDTSSHPALHTAQPGPTSPQLEKDAARAMSSTDSWKPSLGGRKQSYAKEDQKRALQMSGVMGEVPSGPGFTEGANGSS